MATEYFGTITVSRDLLADRTAFIATVGTEVFELLIRTLTEHNGAPIVVQLQGKDMGGVL